MSGYAHKTWDAKGYTPANFDTRWITIDAAANIVRNLAENRTGEALDALLVAEAAIRAANPTESAAR